MKLVGDFLQRFQNLTPPDDAVRKAITIALYDVVRATIKPENIKIQHGVAFVKTSSVVKNTIQLNRAKILNHVFENLPKARENIRDIR